MKRSHTFTALAAIPLAGALCIGNTASAAGRPAGDLGPAKARCTAAITERQNELNSLSGKAAGAAQLTDAHESTIASFLSSAKSGLSELQTKIDADTDPATLRADCDAVRTEFRVFALRAPQVHMAIAGDRQAAGLTKATTIAAKLQTAIQTAADNGKDVTSETAKLAEMNGLLADASSKLGGVVDAELSVTVTQWNSDHTVLSATNTALHAAQNDLRAALADAKAIIAELKA